MTRAITNNLLSHRLWIGLAAGLALALSAATSFAAGKAPADAGSHKSLNELQTAQVHTGYAAEADSLDKARMHLKQAANCLVAPNAANFNADVGNPCDGLGAIPDSTDPQRVSLTQEALAQINDGIRATTLSGAQQSAEKATETLRSAVPGPTIDNE